MAPFKVLVVYVTTVKILPVLQTCLMCYSMILLKSKELYLPDCSLVVWWIIWSYPSPDSMSQWALLVCSDSVVHSADFNTFITSEATANTLEKYLRAKASGSNDISLYEKELKNLRKARSGKQEKSRSFADEWDLPIRSAYAALDSCDELDMQGSGAHCHVCKFNGS